MQRFIAPSARPKATATRDGAGGLPAQPSAATSATRISAANAEPPERRARRPELVEQLDGERRAELQRRDREQDERRRPRHARPGALGNSALAVPQLAQRRAVPHALCASPSAATRPPRRTGAGARCAPRSTASPRCSRLAQRRLARRQQRAARAAAPRARVRVEERDLAARRHDEADHLAFLLRHDLAARERRRAHGRQRLLAGEAPRRAARGEEQLGHGGVVGRFSRAHARAGRARAWPLPRAAAPR